jgi:hypothetical protein
MMGKWQRKSDDSRLYKSLPGSSSKEEPYESISAVVDISNSERSKSYHVSFFINLITRTKTRKFWDANIIKGAVVS